MRIRFFISLAISIASEKPALFSVTSRKLEQALEIYFQENPDRESDKYQEIQKYLKLRIRSVMELLIENEDTERMEQIEKCGWFSANELENFIRCAQEKAKLRSLVWLLHLKDKKYGYQKKDFSL